MSESLTENDMSAPKAELCGAACRCEKNGRDTGLNVTQKLKQHKESTHYFPRIFHGAEPWNTK